MGSPGRYRPVSPRRRERRARAFPNEWGAVDIVEAPKSSLGPERFDAFAARGWIPE
jgi:hypothetical protein